MLKYGKLLILVYFLEKRSDIVNRFFVNLYIIMLLGRLFKVMSKTYRFMCKIFKTMIYLKFCYIFFMNIRFLIIF